MFDGAEQDSKVDVWSIGCILFQMCNNDFPFNHIDEKGLVQKIRYMPHKQISFRMSQDIKDLYEICMNKNFKTRPTILEILGLDFI